jgi:hypothetical protein
MTTGPVRFGAAHHLGKWVPWIPMGTHRDTHRTPTGTPTGHPQGHPQDTHRDTCRNGIELDANHR